MVQEDWILNLEDNEWPLTTIDHDRMIARAIVVDDEGYFYFVRANRDHLTEALRNGAGHIGYSIKKDEREKGYGTAGLELTIAEAKKIIPEDEIYLRVNKDNIASQKVMMNNGAYRAGEDEDHYFMRIKKVSEE